MLVMGATMARSVRSQLKSDIADGDLTQDHRREMPVDRIAALASASDLGSALTRLAADYCARHLHRAIHELDEAAYRSIPRAKQQKRDDLTKLAMIAILEWIQPNCGRCQGKQYVQDGRSSKPHPIPCPKCEGSGLHRYTTGERGRAFGRRLAPSQYEILDQMHRMIADHDALAGRTVARVVGRD